MAQDVCKLCLKVAEIQRSHLVPAAMYKYATDPGSERPNTERVDRRGRRPVIRQVRAPLLCRECELRISEGGENWMMKQVWHGKTQRFPLLDLLTIAMEMPGSKGTTFSGRDCGIDTDKLGYFALSVLWRAAVREWPTEKDERYQIQLGEYEEVLRQYLLGTTDFPRIVSLMATVCSDPLSRYFSLPAVAKFKIPITAFAMMALGINLLVILGRYAPEQICCVRSAQRVISKRDCRKKNIESLAHLFPTQ
jgi:hypothetical protein